MILRNILSMTLLLICLCSFQPAMSQCENCKWSAFPGKRIDLKDGYEYRRQTGFFCLDQDITINAVLYAYNKYDIFVLSNRLDSSGDFVIFQSRVDTVIKTIKEVRIYRGSDTLLSSGLDGDTIGSLRDAGYPFDTLWSKKRIYADDSTNIIGKTEGDVNRWYYKGNKTIPVRIKVLADEYTDRKYCYGIFIGVKRSAGPPKKGERRFDNLD